MKLKKKVKSKTYNHIRQAWIIWVKGGSVSDDPKQLGKSIIRQCL